MRCILKCSTTIMVLNYNSTHSTYNSTIIVLLFMPIIVPCKLSCVLDFVKNGCLRVCVRDSVKNG